jgi:hypothetical protein
MRRPSARLVIGVLTLAVLAASIPGSLREAREHGGFYLLSIRFFEDIPRRLAGPGRMRFLVQPALAIAFGWKAGRSDASEGRPFLLRRLFGGTPERATLVKETLEGIGVLLLMGVLMDSFFQWILLGISYPGAALVVGPVLITVPYVVARALTGALSARAPAVESSRQDHGGRRT